MKIARISLGLLTALLLFSSCKTADSLSYSTTSPSSYKSEAPADRMILYSASMILEADIPDTAIARIDHLSKMYKGYITEISETSIYLRVPNASLDEVMAAVGTLGKVIREQKSGRDVSDEYTDLGIRLENAQKARQRYLELLEKAANVEEALLVEKELERLNGTIDQLTGRMKGLEEREASM